MDKKEIDEKIQSLHRRCSGVDGNSPTEKDLTELYQLIHQILKSATNQKVLSILNSLNQDREDYISEFWIEKIFLKLSPQTSILEHSGVLITWFKNYLLDCYRKENKRGILKQNQAEFDEGRDYGNEGDLEEHNYEEDEDIGDIKKIGSTLQDDCNNSLENVSTSASTFLIDLKAHKNWAWLILRYHYFPDEEDQIPLDRLAQQHKIPSKANKAAKLGINHKFERGVNHFEKTLLGDWLKKTLKLEKITLENTNCIHACLKILGFITLKE